MTNGLFLEFKFGDYDLDILRSVNADTYIVTKDTLTPKRLADLRSLNRKLEISFAAFVQGSCPLNPESKNRLQAQLASSLIHNPKSIWLDHFRFDGKWERSDGNFLNIHPDCEHCKGKNRAEEIANLAHWAKSQLPEDINLGYFAIPFKTEATSVLVTTLAQDHKRLLQSFDCVSPMLYQQMINKPISYISEYVQYLSVLANKPILPIIQVKSMPDELRDNLTAGDLKKEYEQAKATPSSGVYWFSLDQAVEKAKTDILTKLF